MNQSEDSTLEDLDGYVTLRVGLDGAVVIELSPNGFRISPDELARLICEVAERLPSPSAGGRDALCAAADAVADLQRTLAAGGYEAFDAAMRRRLGIAEPDDAPPIRSSERDAALAAVLGSTAETMREGAKPGTESGDVLEAVAETPEGDLAVATSDQRVIAGVRIGAAARSRGVDGLGQALTDLLARARSELRERSSDRIRAELPEGVAETMDEAPTAGERAGRLGGRMIDDIVQQTEALRRKAGLQ